jgi:hypothetical protein
VNPPRNLWTSLTEAVVDSMLAFVIVVVAGFLFFSGCATIGPPLPAPTDGSEQAASIIWKAYGRTDALPLIRWVRGKALVCTDPNSGKGGFWIVDVDPDKPNDVGIVVCREGFTWSPLEVLCADHGELSFSEKVLAHELKHVDLLRRGIFKNHHQLPEFYRDVDAANQRVLEAGR